MIAKRARFLILRGGAIGDFIVTLPALSALRARWPDAYIELIGYPHIAALARDSGLVDRIDSLDRAGMATFFSLLPQFSEEQIQRIRSFDVILSYLHDPNGTVQNNLYLAGAKQVIYGSPLVGEGIHAVDHLLKPLEALAIYEAGAAPVLRMRDEQNEWARTYLQNAGIGERAWILHPGSGSPRKNWPVDRYRALADRLRREQRGTPVFLLGEADHALVAELKGRTVFSDLTLPQVASLIGACYAYVGNDSGITHLAAAVGAPVTALFGPGSVAQWAPRGARVTTLAAEGGDLDRITVDDVWRSLPE